MKMKLTQADIDKPTLKEINTGDKCMLAIAAKRLFKTQNVETAYTNHIKAKGITYQGDKNMKEFLAVLQLVADKKISRHWLKPMAFNLKEV